MRGIVLFFLLSGILTACGGSESPAEQNKLQIVTTIKPLQAIVTAISAGIADSHQLIPDSASPHNYSFKPSDIRKVKHANVIFRIDEHLEVMLSPVFENLAKDVQLISLAEHKDISLLQISAHENASSDHDHGSVDFHIWTSPKNTLAMAKTIAKTLGKLDPDNQSQYDNNLATFTHQLQTEVAEITQLLAGSQQKPYIVFHNSWQYFADEFQLQKPVVVSLHEGITPGAKTISEIRQIIVKQNIDCLFTNPYVAKAQIQSLLETQDMKVVEIDVLARQLKLNQDTYIDWLKTMAKQVSNCLQN